ncbi:hypothetical protein Tco_0828036, partial [Tanacetum coccineum]
MLVQPTEDEGATLKRQSELLPTPSPLHLSADQHDHRLTLLPDLHLLLIFLIPFQRILVGILEIKKLKKQAKPVISHHKAWVKSVSLKHRLAGKKSLKKQWMQKESVSKQGRKPAKAEHSIHKDPAFDELADDTLDYMETEDAQDVGRTRNVVHEENESADNEVSTENALSTAQPKVSTDKEKVSTDKEEVST